MSQGPTVDFVINVRNGERFVEEAVRSALAQTYPVSRVHVVDDGSTDATADIVKSIEDARVELTTQPPRGVPFAKNVGLERVSGELVAYLDADDVSRPDRIDRQVAFLRQNPDVVAVGSALELMDAAGRRVGLRRYPTSDDAIRKLLPFASPFAQSAVLARTEVMRRAGGYDERYQSANDYSLWLKLSTIGRLGNLPEPLVRYRLHSEQRTRRVTKTILREAIQVRLAVGRYGLPRGPKYWLTLGGQALLLPLPASVLVRLHRRLIRR